MKTRRQKIVAALIGAAISLTLAFPALAHGGGRHHGGHWGKAHMERMAEKLGLTAEQRSAAERLHEQAREQSRPYVEQLGEQRSSMRALMEAETFDEAAVRDLMSKKQAAKTELGVIHARTRFEFGKLLTPEQREKLAEMKRGHHKHGHGHGHGGHGDAPAAPPAQ
jgi:protein CpxP